jgi:hypothetical protein
MFDAQSLGKQSRVILFDLRQTRADCRDCQQTSAETPTRLFGSPQQKRTINPAGEGYDQTLREFWPQ